MSDPLKNSSSSGESSANYIQPVLKCSSDISFERKYPMASEPTPPCLSRFTFEENKVIRRLVEYPYPVPAKSNKSQYNMKKRTPSKAFSTENLRAFDPRTQQSSKRRHLSTIPSEEVVDLASSYSTPPHTTQSAQPVSTVVTSTTTSPTFPTGKAADAARGRGLPTQKISSTSFESSQDFSSDLNSTNSKLQSDGDSPSYGSTLISPVGPNSNPTGPLETPLSPANSPKFEEEEEEKSASKISNSASTSLSRNDNSNTCGTLAQNSSSSHASKIDTQFLNSIILENLTTPPQIPEHLVSANDICNIVNNFSTMPTEVKRHVLFKILKSCDRSTLSMMSGLMVTSLKHDMIRHLPSEVAQKVLGNLDVVSLCKATMVSKFWRTFIDSSEHLWRNLLIRDEYKLTQAEVNRAREEQWSYNTWGISPSATPQERLEHTRKIFPLESIKLPINVYKAIYRRKYLVCKNWMNPNSTPNHLSLAGRGNDVITCLQFDDDKIITGSDDYTISVYDTKTGALRSKLTGHDGGVWALKYVGNTLISGSTDRTIRIWDIEKARCTHIYQGHHSTVRSLDVLQPVKIGTDKWGADIIAPKETLLITGSRDTTLKVWRLPKPGDAPPENEPPIAGSSYCLRTLKGHDNSVRAVSGYGDLVVSGSYDNNVRVWEVETGKCRWILRGHVQRVYSAVIDYKRQRCISGSMDWYVKVWSLETGTLTYTLEGHTSLVGLLDLNRTSLVSAAADATLRVWNPDDGTFLHKLEGHKGAITSFQHDELKVVSGSETTLKLWNIRTGELIRDLLDGFEKVWQVRFDENRCVAAVMRNEKTSIEVLDFDYDPYTNTTIVKSSSSATPLRISHGAIENGNNQPQIIPSVEEDHPNRANRIIDPGNQNNPDAVNFAPTLF